MKISLRKVFEIIKKRLNWNGQLVKTWEIVEVKP